MTMQMMTGGPSPNDVVRALQQGRPREALEMARRLIKVQPRDPALLQLAAISALQTGAIGEGIDFLRMAHALRPNDPAIAFNLAKALGDGGLAEQGYSLASRREFAAIPDFQRLRAELARHAGRHAEARQALEALLATAPDDPTILNNLGTACMAMGDTAAAVDALEAAQQLDGLLPTVQVNLAKAYGLAGRSAEALNAARRAVELAPADLAAAVELARALRATDQAREALAGLVRQFEANRGSAELAVEIGLTFSALAEFDRAEEAYRQALKLDPGHAQACLNLGILHEQANRLDELDALIAKTRQIGIESPEIDFLDALAARRKGDLATARKLAEREDPDEAVNPGVRFHLVGQIADSLGDRSAAFAAFTAMNSAAARTARGKSFTGSEYPAYIRQFNDAVTSDWVDSWPRLEAGARPSPVFLVGFPRSGTTLLDTMLMGHPATHVLEEEPVLAAVHEQVGDLARIPELDQAAVDQLRNLYFEGVAALGPVPPGRLIIDKLPLNLVRTPLILRLFPDAKFILALRHPCDCVLSCFMQNFQVNRAMASFWSVESAARTYDAAFTFWENCRRLFDIDVHTLRYEDLIADQHPELARLVDFLGLEDSEDMLDFNRTARERGRVRTPSYAQITQAVYQTARGRWEGYREQLQPALPLLAPWAMHHGYPDPLAG